MGLHNSTSLTFPFSSDFFFLILGGDVCLGSPLLTSTLPFGISSPSGSNVLFLTYVLCWLIPIGVVTTLLTTAPFLSLSSSVLSCWCSSGPIGTTASDCCNIFSCPLFDLSMTVENTRSTFLGCL